MGYLFISYSSKDRDFALRLAQDLKRVGFDIWIDRWKITGRQPYWDEIQSGIEGCTHFLFLISPEAIDRASGSRKELYHAGGLKPAPQMIPMMVRDTPFNQLPILISPGEYQIHDFVHNSYEDAFQDVLDSIRGGTGQFKVPVGAVMPTRPVPTSAKEKASPTSDAKDTDSAISSDAPDSSPSLKRFTDPKLNPKTMRLAGMLMGVGVVIVLGLLILTVAALMTAQKDAQQATTTAAALAQTQTPEAAAQATQTKAAQIKALTLTASVSPTATKKATTTGSSDGVIVSPNENYYSVNIRSGPGLTFPRYGTFQKGDQLQAVGTLPDHTWVVVKFKGLQGWVSSDVVDITGDINTLPYITPPPSPTPTNTPTSTPTATLTATDTPTAVGTQTPDTTTGTPTPFRIGLITPVLRTTRILLVTPAFTVVCTNIPLTSRMKIGITGRVIGSNSLKVLSDTSTSATVVGSVSTGDKFTVVDGYKCLDSIPYWQIKTDTLIGWIPEMSQTDYYIEPLG